MSDVVFSFRQRILLDIHPSEGHIQSSLCSSLSSLIIIGPEIKTPMATIVKVNQKMSEIKLGLVKVGVIEQDTAVDEVIDTCINVRECKKEGETKQNSFHFVLKL